MRCVFESRLDKLDLYPFPGLKVINIRGSSLLALDLIIIGNFVAKLDEKNRLLEMALRDYPLDRTGLLGLIPCIPLIRCGNRKRSYSKGVIHELCQQNLCIFLPPFPCTLVLTYSIESTQPMSGF